MLQFIEHWEPYIQDLDLNIEENQFCFYILLYYTTPLKGMLGDILYHEKVKCKQDIAYKSCTR